MLRPTATNAKGNPVQTDKQSRRRRCLRQLSVLAVLLRLLAGSKFNYLSCERGTKELTCSTDTHTGFGPEGATTGGM